MSSIDVLTNVVKLAQPVSVLLTEVQYLSSKHGRIINLLSYVCLSILSIASMFVKRTPIEEKVADAVAKVLDERLENAQLYKKHGIQRTRMSRKRKSVRKR